MKKLKLMLDELRVETFETVDSTGRRGTVVGQGDSSAGPINCQTQCPGATDLCFTDFGCETGPDACMVTADYTCDCVSNEIECAPSDNCASWEISACPEYGNC